MKKYIDYMNKITADMLFEGLLGYGLFSEKLPPIFTSKKFMEYIDKRNWDLSGYNSNKARHKWINVEIMRNTNVPRNFGIPNPFAYYHLCRFLEANWGNIKEHFRKKTFGLKFNVSRIHLQKIKDSKKIFKMNYQNWRYEDISEDDLAIGAKYIVKTDISSCFPSIYTHAIPWAVMGKEEAKRYMQIKHKLSKKEWSDELDIHIRNTQNKETHGVMIGPHASNLVSEIILTGVDECLNKWKYVRYIDDYRCYVPSYEDGECFISSLTKALKYYGLSLNHKKTKIEKLPAGEIELWVNKMNRAKLSLLPSTEYMENHDSDAKRTIGYNELKQYLLYAIENGLEDAAPINYAVKVLCKNYIISDKAKSYFYKKMLYLAAIYPYLLRLLEEFVFDLSDEKVEKAELSNRIFKDAMMTGRYEEAYYALLFAIKYDFHIEMDGKAHNAIIESNDCILLLISWLYFNKYNDGAMKNRLRERAKSISEDEFDEYWLFVYECLSADEFTCQYAQYWKTLKKDKVSFIRDEWLI